MTLKLPTLSQDVLAIAGSFDEGVVHVRFVGTADIEAKADLIAIVKAMHDEVIRLTATKVVLDLRGLEFMNSSSFKIFVTWLTRIQDLPPAEQYRVHLLANPNLHWQRRSLAALSCFAVDLVTIEM